MGRVAHEVAMQPAGLLGAREVVLRPGEMVHADVTVAGGAEPVDRELEERDARGGVRKRLAVDVALRLEEPRHVRIAVDREPVRTYRDNGIERAPESLQGLMRQSVDEVDVDRAKPRCPARIDDAERLL